MKTWSWAPLSSSVWEDRLISSKTSIRIREVKAEKQYLKKKMAEKFSKLETRAFRLKAQTSAELEKKYYEKYDGYSTVKLQNIKDKR